MDAIYMHTPLGLVPLVGRLRTSVSRPVLLAITGAFPPKGHLHDLVDKLGRYDVVVGNLPGMITSPLLLGENSIRTFIAAYEAVLKRLFQDQPVVAFGISTGALIALGLQKPVAKVAVEPFFRTAHLTPFISHLRDRLRRTPDQPKLAPYIHELFGVTEDGLEDRDYRGIAARINVPTRVLVGTVPLHAPRWEGEFPSFTDEDDRKLLARNPNVQVIEGPPGTNHDFCGSPEGERLMLQALEAALEAVS